jgi:copper chaperone
MTHDRPTSHELTIEGMSCGHCVAAVRDALTKVPGVTWADVTLDASKLGHARVEGGADRAALVAAIEAEDYRVA